MWTNRDLNQNSQGYTACPAIKVGEYLVGCRIGPSPIAAEVARAANMIESAPELLATLKEGVMPVSVIAGALPLMPNGTIKFSVPGIAGEIEADLAELADMLNAWVSSARAAIARAEGGE